MNPKLAQALKIVAVVVPLGLFVGYMLNDDPTTAQARARKGRRKHVYAHAY